MLSSFRKALALPLLLLASLSAHGLDVPRFAQSLEAEGDWYRAIGLWKQVRFEAQSPDILWTANQAIIADLWAAKQFSLGLAEVTRLEAAGNLDSSPRRKALLSWRGLFLYRLSQFPAAEYSWSLSGTPLYQGLLAARTNRTEQVRSFWSEPELLGLANQPVETKSPLLGASLSFLVPGLGQVYAGHWFDGAQATALVGFFGLAAYGTYLYDSKYSSNYVLTGVAVGAFALFHSSNVYGAYKTAEFFNRNQENARMEALETAVLSRPLPNLSSND